MVRVRVRVRVSKWVGKYLGELRLCLALRLTY